MTVQRKVCRLIDDFNRAQVFSTTPGHNGWTIKDTSPGGSPSYECISEDEGAARLLLAATNEAEIVTLFQNDVLSYRLDHLHHLWWIAKVSGIDAATTLALGLASAQNDTLDSVATNAWFRIEGSDSTENIVVETDDGTTDDDDNASGLTLGSEYKKLMLDFTDGLSKVRFHVDGEVVDTLNMGSLAAGARCQPFVQLQKASGTGTPSVTIAQFGVQYETAYGV